MQTVWSPLAIEKATQFATTIALDKPMVVDKWLNELFGCVQRLTELPYSGKMVSEIQRKDIREVFHGNYRIIYKLTTDQVQILTVRHRRELLDGSEITG